MNRRVFIATLLASAGSVLIDKTPLIASVHGHEWMYLKWVDPRRVQEDWPQMVAHLIGRRTDGNHYFVAVPMGLEEAAHPLILERSKEHARDTLDTFLNCSCSEGNECALHSAMFRISSVD